MGKKPDLPAGLPGFRRGTCLGCELPVVAAREAYAVIGGRRDGTWLIVMDAEPDRSFATNPHEMPTDAVLLGVAHRHCLETARRRLQEQSVLLPEALPALMMEEIDEGEPYAALHLPSNSASCPFCGASQTTREDVWPKWFSKLFGPGKPFVTGPSKKPARYIPVTAPVCGRCNNVVLSAIETAAQPILSKMITGQPEVTLQLDDQMCVATWAAKTALTLDAASVTPIVPVGFYRQLRQLKAPLPSMLILTGGYNGTRPVFADISGLHLHSNEGTVSTSPNGFVATFGAWRALFQVFGHFTIGGARFQESRIAAHLGLHRLWPSREETISWPKNGFAFNDEMIVELIESVSHRLTPRR